MNQHYEDILTRVPEQPQWFDEHAVPRFVAFAPRLVANIYAEEVALVHIECQNCGAAFKVAFSWSLSAALLQAARMGGGSPSPSLAEQIAESGCLEYGDPPNVRCCPSGPTMNSVSRRVLEFWRRDRSYDWVRSHELEKVAEPAWWTENEATAPTEPTAGKG